MNPPYDRTASPPRRRRLAAVVVSLALALGAASCSSDEDPADPAGAASSGSPSATAPPSVKPVSKVLKVTGKLPPKRRQAVRKAVVAQVDKWLEAAYVGGDFPRGRATFRNAFPGFTSGAKQAARRNLALTTNAGVAGKVEGVTTVNKAVGLDILAVRGRVAGVTARVGMKYDLEGSVKGRYRIVGELAMVPGKKGGWRVVAFDIRRQTVKG